MYVSKDGNEKVPLCLLSHRSTNADVLGSAPILHLSPQNMKLF